MLNLSSSIVICPKKPPFLVACWCSDYFSLMQSTFTLYTKKPISSMGLLDFTKHMSYSITYLILPLYHIKIPQFSLYMETVI